MILMGVLMFTGKMNDITGYLSMSGNTEAEETETSQDDTAGADGEGQSGTAQDTDGDESAGDETAENAGDENAGDETAGKESSGDDNETEEENQASGAYEFELTDQFGKTHTLDEYKGKVIFLNFWATWCGPCRNEMPEIQKLYEEYQAQGEEAEVVILGVAAPGLGQEGSEEEITAFMEENGYTYPVLMDQTGEMFSFYGISAFPTTFMIDRDGNVYGYVQGQLSEDIMRSIIDQTLEGGA